ncbi:MAG: hypothetical protein JWO06_920 [Bacteroidota bacterium]|nr:hypothetical protein [Bacteroidota bacterium]
MEKIFEAKYGVIEASRKNLLNNLKKYPDDILNKKPSPQAWSVVQVIEHLMASEELSLKYLQKKTQDTSKSKNAGLTGKWRLFITKAMFSVPVKFKSPALLNPPADFVSLNDLETKWEQIRHDLFQLLSKLPAKDLQKDIWKHAVAGKMNVFQMVEFFNFHFKRHRKQITRTIAQVSK